MAEDSRSLAKLRADLPSGTAEQPFWEKIRGNLKDIQDDRAKELAGIRRLGQQGRL
jgi:hypothetical protein